MAEVLTIPAEDMPITLREMASLADDQLCLDAIQEDPEHLDNFGMGIGSGYRNRGDVTAARHRAVELGMLRFAIWGADMQFKGSATAFPDKDKTVYEIGYWLRKSALHQGYATMAVLSLTRHLRTLPQDPDIIAAVHEENFDSMRVLWRADFHAYTCVSRIWGPAIEFEPTEPWTGQQVDISKA